MGQGSRCCRHFPSFHSPFLCRVVFTFRLVTATVHWNDVRSHNGGWFPASHVHLLAFALGLACLRRIKGNRIPSGLGPSSVTSRANADHTIPHNIIYAVVYDIN